MPAPLFICGFHFARCEFDNVTLGQLSKGLFGVARH